MHPYRAILGLAVLLCITGCASLSTDPRLVGIYAGANSESLVFQLDARVFHTQSVNGKEERVFLGYYFSRSNDPGTLNFAGPDTSRFLGTSFSVSEDFSTVTVAWGNFYRPDLSWQLTYRKKAE